MSGVFAGAWQPKHESFAFSVLVSALSALFLTRCESKAFKKHAAFPQLGTDKNRAR